MYGYRKRACKLTDLGNGLQKIYDAKELGGEVDLCEVLPEHKEQASRASQALGSEIIGFDMIWHKESGQLLLMKTPFRGSTLIYSVRKAYLWPKKSTD